MQRDASTVFGETPQRWLDDSEQASRLCSTERASHRLPVEDGARAERSPPVVGVDEPRGVAEPVGARHPRHDGRRQAMVVPQRRGEPRVVARVVPEPLRHYDDTRRASRTLATRGEERGGGGGGGATGRMTAGLGNVAVPPALAAARSPGGEMSGSMSPPSLCVRCLPSGGGEWLAVARRAPPEAKPRSDSRTRSIPVRAVERMR